MTMTRATQQVTPAYITATQASSRLQDVRDLAQNEDYPEAMAERAQLCMDVLYTIYNAKTIADKAELKRLAGIALEAFEIPIVARPQTP